MSTERWFVVQDGTAQQRERVRAFLPHLDLVGATTAERIVSAWTTAWLSSEHDEIEELAYTSAAPEYRLIDHVREVGEIGTLLAGYRERTWGGAADPEILVPALLLHDVDKPLLSRPSDGAEWVRSAADLEVPHGVLGSYILRELGIDDRVVSIVATHAANAPYHSRAAEAWILHYADFFSCDHALIEHGAAEAVPFYQRHWA